MYTKKSLRSFIFFDTETVPAWASFDDMPKNLQKIWLEKYHFKALEKEIEYRQKETAITLLESNTFVDYKHMAKESPTVNDIFIKEAALHPEFSKIYCISFGMFDKEYNAILSTFCEPTEKETIKNFLEVLHHYQELNLFGYNSNEFDIPFLLKRMWLNGIFDHYPLQLQLKDSKPWTVKHQDHMVNYKAGSWSNVSLGLLCEVFDVPTPKDEFNNSEFTTLLLSGKITKDDAIKYCEKDVKALMDIVMKVSSDHSNFEVTAKVWPKKPVTTA